MTEQNTLVVFQNKRIRRIWYNNEWYFSVVDVIEALTESGRARKYWSDLKIKLSEDGFEVSEKIGQLKLPAEDGKLRETDCANTTNMFRIIQSIPSKKAEPFKQWLAQVGYEWKQRGVKEDKEYAILTNEISKATFGKTVDEYKEFKKLNKENLRDHMNDLELIFTMLGEAATTTIARGKDAQGFGENKGAAKEGGKVAGDARKNLEVASGEKIVTRGNYLEETEQKKRMKANKTTPLLQQ
jgi:prophage antirepressor-like protein